MRRGISALVNRAARLTRVNFLASIAPPSSQSIAPLSHVEGSLQAPHGRALHGLISARGSTSSGAAPPAPLRDLHGIRSPSTGTVAPAARPNWREGCSTQAAAAPLRSDGVQSRAGQFAAQQTAWRAGLHSSAAARDDEDRGRRGDLQSAVHAAEQQLQQPSTTAASGASQSGGGDGAAFRALVAFDHIHMIACPILHVSSAMTRQRHADGYSNRCTGWKRR